MLNNSSEFKQDLLDYLYKVVDISEISQIAMLCEKCSASDLYIEFLSDHHIRILRLVFKEDKKK